MFGWIFAGKSIILIEMFIFQGEMWSNSYGNDVYDTNSNRTTQNRPRPTSLSAAASLSASKFLHSTFKNIVDFSI